MVPGFCSFSSLSLSGLLISTCFEKFLFYKIIGSHFCFFQGKTLISDSGDIIDKTWRGGRVGIFVFSQENVYFSALRTCNSKVAKIRFYS